MKHVWVNFSTWALTASTTRCALLPTLVTAMPDPKSIRLLPSMSTTTPPAARSAKTGMVVPTPAATAAALRAIKSCDRGPGRAVTKWRRWGI